MLTRFIKIQLTIFAIVSAVGLIAMALVYMRLPTLLGMGGYTVTMKFPDASGLYRFGNVTLRGVQIGEVTGLRLTRDGAEASLRLNRSPRVPADLEAEVRSVSAVGEQYVDLLPNTDSGPFLGNGSVIDAGHVRLPQAVGPMLDSLSSLAGSVPRDRLADLLTESSEAFGGKGFDMGSLIDSGARLGRQLAAVAPNAAALTTDSAPLLNAQNQTTDALRTWARSLAGVTTQISADEPQVRGILHDGPGALQEATRLFDDVKPTLPILLANLTSLAKVGVTYNPGLRQILLLLPPYIASLQTFALPLNTYDGMPQGDFVAAIGDPPACTVGFLPQSQWRSPEDTKVVDTPDGLYCKLPQDSPLAVRGARNVPCMDAPGKRAPTVEMCRSDKPFMPLAMHQHVLGPNPPDPNLIAQGIAPDSRSLSGQGLYGPVEGTPPPGPVEGTPPPQQSVPSGTADDGPAQPTNNSPVPSAPDAVPAAPASASGPIAFSQYDPATGRYLAGHGQTFQQTDLGTTPHDWRDLFSTGH